MTIADISYILNSPGNTQLDDDGTDNIVYVGSANPGVATNQPGWSIKKIFYNDRGNISSINNANANSGPVFIWDNRASYTYTPTGS